jgi:purine-binding chemotaxis protein CheW
MSEAAPSASAAAQRRFLTFRTAQTLYALPAEAVSEVIRLPALARVPHAPHALLGLANLRGGVIPVASLPRLLGDKDTSVGAGARALVLSGAHPMALAVDAVETVIAVDADEVETDQAALAAEPGEALLAVVRAGESGAAKVLDLQNLLAAAFVQPAQSIPGRAAHAPRATGTIEAAEIDPVKLVVFDVAGQSFALDLDAVDELIDAPAEIARAPKAEALVIGVADHRGALLPLFSLRALLGLAGDAEDAERKVVVTWVRGARAGLVVDRLRAVSTTSPDRIEPTPAALAARIGGETRVTAMVRGEDGRLVSILSPESLFRDEVMQRLIAKADTTGPQADDTEVKEISVLVFRLDGDEYALPIEAVDEVGAAPSQITRLPKAPAFLEGVINLRGEVLPVIDQRRRFDLPAAPSEEGRRLVIVRTIGRRAALIVDSVAEVLRRPAEAVTPPPALAGEAGRLVLGVINLDAAGRMLLLLDPAELLSQAERALLDALDKDGGPASR